MDTAYAFRVQMKDMDTIVMKNVRIHVMVVNVMIVTGFVRIAVQKGTGEINVKTHVLICVLIMIVIDTMELVRMVV